MKSFPKNLDHLAAAIGAGDLSLRLPEQNFEGHCQETAMTVNRMLDAIVSPLKEVISVLTNLSVNDVTAKVAGHISWRLRRNCFCHEPCAGAGEELCTDPWAT